MATTIMFRDEDGVFRAVSADNPLPTTGSGGGGGAVESVNGKTGEVTLTSEDIEVTVDGESAGGNITQSLQSQANSLNQFANDFSAALQDKLDTPTGTANSTTYARGDGTWATPPNTTYSVVSQANIENPASTSSGLITGQRLAQGVAAQIADEEGVVGIGRVVYIREGDAVPTVPDYTQVIVLPAEVA